LTATPVFQGDISPASLLLELPVFAHFRISASAPADKTIHPWIVLFCRKEHCLF